MDLIGSPDASNPLNIGPYHDDMDGIFPAMIELLHRHNAGRLRSAFRKSLAEQIIDWAEDACPTHRSPLSDRQCEALDHTMNFGNSQKY